MIELIGSEPCRERDLVCAMIAARIIRPHSKLATTRWWKDTTLGEMFGVDDAEVDELYAAMDWLGKRQNRIQGKLALCHFRDGGLVLFDLTSGYFEGMTCPLGRRGHNRDGKKGKLQVNFGLPCDVGGCPVSVSVYAGNIGDPKTLLPEVARLQKRFGLQRVAIVSDRGTYADLGSPGSAIFSHLPSLPTTSTRRPISKSPIFSCCVPGPARTLDLSIVSIIRGVEKA